jgi:multiple sugar transport system permease protein
MMRNITALKENIFVIAVISSIIVVLLLVVIWPVAQVVGMSFFKIKLGADPKPIGLANYSRIARDPKFWYYLWNSVIYTLGSLSISFLISMAVALGLNKIEKFKGIYRAMILLPWAIPEAVASLVWRIVLNDQIGILNYLLLGLGIIRVPILWLGEPEMAMFSVILADSWTRIPLITVLLLAGLQGIQEDLYEAAKIDGANGFDRFRYITIPLLRSTISVTLIIVGIFIFRTYTMIAVLTNGGPGDTTEVFTTYIFQTGFVLLDQGYSSALSVVMFIIVVGISLLYRNRSVYGR